ncbi:unnamed protein product [Pelagomonas calceolata]|uniref:Tyrosine-protein phosphatase domain-containing protein n=1 Tax=Pelagomonas calceolata TaxID=35677 RepID=A0A8J2S8Y8_9STRA|nr:unnamed protein product [Pelagomonas calceolata]
MAAQQANFRMEPGSDAMKQRMQAMMRYNRLRQETRASNAVLQVKRKHQRREAVDPRADETSLERQQMQDRSYYEYGCVTDGLRADLGLERYHEDLANHSASVQESAARPIEEDLEEGEDDDERRREKARRRRKAGMRDIRVHPFEVDELDHRCCRGQMPGWDPYRYSQQMLETEAENMRQLRMSVADNKQTKKLTGTSKITLDLQRPGPTTLTPVDFAKYLARCEGLTLAEWCKEQDVRTERALERERFKITERVKRAEKEAEDPRPDRKQFRDAEVALVAKRCGAGAMRKARNRLGKSMKPSRRARDASSVLGMMLLRSQGFGMVHPEQDVFWIEHELLMAKERIEPRRERLVGPVLSNQHPQDFIYCRLYVSDKETARQDDIRREFGMGLAFASEALDLGGRVLICCPTGCRLAVAATVALLMQKRGMRLSTAYGVVKLHEPALQLSRALCLWLSLYEIELHHESSVVRDRTFTNPSLKQLVGELGLEPALPWPLPIYFLVGTVVLPDPFGVHPGYYCCCYCVDPAAICRGAAALARKLRPKKTEDDAVSHASVASVDFDVGTFASASVVTEPTVATSASAGAFIVDEPRSPDRRGRRGRRAKKASAVAAAAAPAPAAADDASVASELTVETFGSLATHGTAVTQGSTVSLRSARPPAEGPAAPEKPGFLARARRFFRRKS